MKDLNTKKQGDVGLGMAIAHFVKTGATVSIPLTDSQKYDLIVDIDGDLKRVQVKTSRFCRNGKYEVMLKTCGGNHTGVNKNYFDGSLVDFLFILTENGDTYLIPTNSSTPRNNIRLSKNYERYIVK